MSDKEFDVVVIGAGIGGVITGAILAAKEGLKVLVIEKSSQIGGRCVTFGKQHGTEFSASEVEDILRSSAHTTLIKSEPDFPTLIQKGLFKDFIIDCGWHGMSGGTRCRFALLASALGKGLPVSNSVGMAYWKDGKWLQLPELVKDWPAKSIKERGRVARERMRLSIEEAAEYDHVGLGMYLESITDDEVVRDYYITMAKYQFDSNYPDEISAGEWIKCNNGTAAVGAHLIHGGGMGEVTGGFKTVCNIFASIITENGGEIRTDKSVKEIIIKDWKVAGVVVEGNNGSEEIKVSKVVSNAPIYSLPSLIDNKYFPADLLQRIKNSYPAVAILGQACLTEPLQKTYPTGQYVVPDMPDIKGRNNPLMFGFEQSSMVDPSRAPDGRYLVQFAVYADPADMKDPKTVNWLADEGVQFFRNQYPRFDETLDWYFLTKSVMVWGVAAAPGIFGDRRFPVKHPLVQGLFFTGDCVEQWDVGSNGAAHGAVLAASALSGRDYLSLLPPYWR